MTGFDDKHMKELAIFLGVDEASVSSLFRRCMWKTCAAGELVIGQEDRSFDVLLLANGRAKINFYSADGQRVSYGEIADGELFGELSAIDGKPRSATVECLQPSAIAIIPRQAFLDALASDPSFAMNVMRRLTSRIRSLTERAFEYGTLRVRERVAAELIRIAVVQCPGNDAPTLSALPSHEEIASRIGSHREAVTREIAWMGQRGLIAKNGRTLQIRSLRRLQELVDHCTAIA